MVVVGFRNGTAGNRVSSGEGWAAGIDQAPRQCRQSLQDDGHSRDSFSRIYRTTLHRLGM